MQKIEEETELIIKTMSEDKNKLVDVLKKSMGNAKI